MNHENKPAVDVDGACDCDNANIVEKVSQYILGEGAISKENSVSKVQLINFETEFFGYIH